MACVVFCYGGEDWVMSRDPGMVSQHLEAEVKGVPGEGLFTGELGVVINPTSEALEWYHGKDDETTGHNYSYRL